MSSVLLYNTNPDKRSRFIEIQLAPGKERDTIDKAVRATRLFARFIHELNVYEKSDRHRNKVVQEIAGEVVETFGKYHKINCDGTMSEDNAKLVHLEITVVTGRIIKMHDLICGSGGYARGSGKKSKTYASVEKAIDVLKTTIQPWRAEDPAIQQRMADPDFEDCLL